MSDAELKAILQSARVIAVLGAHRDLSRAAAYVPEYLAGVGYRIIPVNPKFTGEVLFGEPVRPDLASIDDPVDVVDVFRPSQAIPGHLEDILAMQPLPKVVWFQLGIRNDEAAAELSARGITVVQDRCMLAEHRRLFGT